MPERRRLPRAACRAGRRGGDWGTHRRRGGRPRVREAAHGHRLRTGRGTPTKGILALEGGEDVKSRA